MPGCPARPVMTNEGLTHRPCTRIADLQAQIVALAGLAEQRYLATDDQYYLGVMDAYAMVRALINDSEAGT